MAETLVPICNKKMMDTFVRGPGSRTRRECWEATSVDGVWVFEREESSGTPWMLYHYPTRTLVSVHGSLRKARRFVASGGAETALQAKLAELAVAS